MTTNRLGEILRDADRYGLRYERRLRHPPERVWRALTESDALRHWMPADMVGERRAGADLVFPFWPAHVERFGIPAEQAALTGRMPAADKDDVMARFAAGPTRADGVDVLVCTTVVEVGVDVPNATLMIVLDADRFGVSQLHQLRGRVGRGAHAGLCLLVTSAPADSPARQRLAAVAATTDGFELSRYDLQSRREGDVLGAAQSGARRSLRLLSVLEHEDVILRARQEATELVAQDPELAGHPLLAAEVAALVDPDHAEYLERT